MTESDVHREIERLRTRNPDAVRLAQRLSLAIVAEPALIRTVRLRLLPSSDAGAEADLWFSGLVESRAPNGIVLSPEIADALRQGLPKGDAKEAWAITQRLHANLSPALQIEEELNYLSLDPTANQARIDALLQSAVGALVGSQPGHLANWAGRAIPRLPATIRGNELTSMLRAASDLRLGRPLAIDEKHRGSGIPSWLYQLLPDVGRAELGVRLGSHGLEIDPASVSGTQTIRVPATEPMVLEVASGKGARQTVTLVFVRAGEVAPPVAVEPGAVRLRTLARQEYVLRPTRRAVLAVGEAPVAAHAFADCNAAVIAWRIDAPIDGCLGFAIERRIAGAKSAEVLRTKVGFSRSSTAPAPMTMAPVQRFRWIDSSAPAKTPLEYRVVPMIGSPASLRPDHQRSSNWTSPVEVDVLKDGLARAYFNRGALVSAEASARGLPGGITTPDSPMRARLGGALLTGLADMLRDSISQDRHLYVAMSGIDDPEIVRLLAQLGKRAHVLIGSPSRSRGRPTYAGKRGAEAAAILRKSVDYQVLRPWRGRRLHTAFAVVCRSDGDPHAVWTAMGPWTTANLCTRMRGGLVIEHAPSASTFLDYWRQLADRQFTGRGAIDGSASDGVSVWFAPAARGHEVGTVRSVIARAREGVLFCTGEMDLFPFTKELDAFADRGGFVAGIGTARRNLVISAGGRTRLLSMDIPFKDLTRELRDPMVNVRGAAHAFRERFIVVDPFGEEPVVITGSHTLTRTGAKQHEDLVMIHGDREIAKQYASRFAQIYARIQFRGQLPSSRPQIVGLERSSEWQNRYLNDERQRLEMEFWTGTSVAGTKRRAYMRPCTELNPYAWFRK